MSSQKYSEGKINKNINNWVNTYNVLELSIFNFMKSHMNKEHQVLPIHTESSNGKKTKCLDFNIDNTNLTYVVSGYKNKKESHFFNLSVIVPINDDVADEDEFVYNEIDYNNSNNNFINKNKCLPEYCDMV